MAANGRAAAPMNEPHSGQTGGADHGAPDEVQEVDLDRRFGGVARLYGQQALVRFGRARIGIVGLGGVGTWAAEALARSGAGRLRLIDLDHVSESNTNRQIHALEPEFGKAKVVAMADRIRRIHPGAQVEAVEEFVTLQNVASLLEGLDLVIDCIDQVEAKAALIARAHGTGVRAITCGGAGGRKDPARIRRDDLARTRGDPLLAALRHRLRHEYGFSRAAGKQVPRFGVTAVFSDEELVWPVAAAGETATVAPGSPLACGGYGSAVTVTATMGFAAAACALELLQAD
jgi:tRNA A37 threonylcarbamoyladenosine dehydratase